MMNPYHILSASPCGSFASRLADLKDQLAHLQQQEAQRGNTIRYARVFLSDAQNQYQSLVESELYQGILANTPTSVVEQPPLNGSKVSLLVKMGKEESGIFQSLRLTEEETRTADSYMQTLMLFEKYIQSMEGRGVDMKTHLVRTWIYVADIDVNYDGVVRARNDIFRRYGLTAETHFIASTGIGGRTHVRHASVAIDFLTYPDIEEADKYYLQALDHLNPTHEYGVAFERGTRVTLPTRQEYFISGTASIDRCGNVLYLGDVERQTERLLENINALLRDGGAELADMRYFIIYLRDLSDHDIVARHMTRRFPNTPHIIVEGKVCRPTWLIEMEGVAVR